MNYILPVFAGVVIFAVLFSSNKGSENNSDSSAGSIWDDLGNLAMS